MQAASVAGSGLPRRRPRSGLSWFGRTDSPQGPNSPIRRAVCPSAGTPVEARRCLATREHPGLCRSRDARSSSLRRRPASSQSRPIRPLRPRSRPVAASWTGLLPTGRRSAFASPNREPRIPVGLLQNDSDRTCSLLIIVSVTM